MVVLFELNAPELGVRISALAGCLRHSLAASVYLLLDSKFTFRNGVHKRAISEKVVHADPEGLDFSNSRIVHPVLKFHPTVDIMNRSAAQQGEVELMTANDPNPSIRMDHCKNDQSRSALLRGLA